MRESEIDGTKQSTHIKVIIINEKLEATEFDDFYCSIKMYFHSVGGDGDGRWKNRENPICIYILNYSDKCSQIRTFSSSSPSLDVHVCVQQKRYRRP
jgi:hypothetical protein